MTALLIAGFASGVPKEAAGSGVYGSGGGGTYDNLANWPSLSNRPVYNAGTQVLTWIGPTGGGASTTTDVQQTRTLTGHSGDLVVSSNGQVIEGLAINGNVNLNGKTGGTIKQCYIQWASGFDQIAATLAATGWTIEDVEIDGTGSAFEGIGNVLHNATVRRLYFHGMENGIAATQNGTTIEDSLFGALSGPDCDGIEFYFNVTSGTIEHCTFDGSGGSGFINSGVNLTSTPMAATGVIVNNTRFINFPSFAICDGDSSSTGEVFAAITNCGFFNNGTNRRGAATVTVNTGNYAMANANATSGTPLHGTGAV